MGRETTLAGEGLGKEHRRKILLWEVGAFVWIMLAGSAFHFIYELSNFNSIAALFGSVNESSSGISRWMDGSGTPEASSRIASRRSTRSSWRMSETTSRTSASSRRASRRGW